MKKLLKVILFCTLIFLVISAAASAYFLSHAKPILLSVLEQRFGLKPEIAEVRVRFPLTMIAEAVAIPDGISVRRITATPSLAGLLSREVILNELVLEQPRMKITRLEDDSFDFSLPKTRPVSQKPLRFYIDKLKITGATIDFLDKGLRETAPFSCQLADLNLESQRVSIIEPFKMRIEGAGRLVSSAAQPMGKVNLSGWVDPLAKDMDLRILLSKLPLKEIEPYRRMLFRAPVASGEADLSADMKSKSNDLVVTCHVAFADVSLEKPSAQPQDATPQGKFSKDMASVLFQAILGEQGAASFDFSFRTRMDRPKFERFRVHGASIKSKFFEGTVRPSAKTAEDFKKIGEDFEAVAKEFKKSFKSP